MESILTSIKKLLGSEEGYTQFDPDIIISINSAILNLNQLGIGQTNGFVVTTKDDKWSDLIGERKDLESVKLYIYLKTRLSFDPPSNSFLVESMNKQITELEWRLNIQV